MCVLRAASGSPWRLMVQVCVDVMVLPSGRLTTMGRFAGWRLEHGKFVIDALTGGATIDNRRCVGIVRLRGGEYKY